MATDEERKYQIMRLVEQQRLKEQYTQQLMAETPVETAQILLQNSAITNLMPEVDKEVKLANLDSIEKFVVHKNIQVFHDLAWFKREQQKKELEAKAKGFKIDIDQDNQLITDIENYLDTEDETAGVFDKVGLLRMSLFIPTLSRGKYGFEREKQVQTISQQKVEYLDKTEEKPSFMGKMFGGFKR